MYPKLSLNKLLFPIRIPSTVTSKLSMHTSMSWKIKLVGVLKLDSDLNPLKSLKRLLEQVAQNTLKECNSRYLNNKTWINIESNKVINKNYLRIDLQEQTGLIISRVKILQQKRKHPRDLREVNLYRVMDLLMFTHLNAELMISQIMVCLIL